jgi:hypothetical protein
MSCSSGKRVFLTTYDAEESLIQAWVNFDYRVGNGPISIYECEDCGNYHLTSRPPMCDGLQEALDSGYIQKEKRSRDWERRF